MEGKCIIFSAPSGSGKTTIVKYLLEQNLGLSFSVSATSREQRSNEQNAKDYHFLGVDGFREKIQQDAFVEWEEVYPNQFYGTLKAEIERIWANGKHVIFDVDVVGGLNIKKAFGDRALSIFVQAPSINDLESRLRGRDTESDESLKKRVGKAREEMGYADRFDRILVNDQLETACAEAVTLIQDYLALPTVQESSSEG